MAEDAFTYEDLPSSEAVQEFLNAFEPKCWVCGSTDWFLRTYLDKPSVSFRTLAAPGSPMHLPCFSLSCVKCFYVADFDMREMMAKIASDAHETKERIHGDG